MKTVILIFLLIGACSLKSQVKWSTFTLDSSKCFNLKYSAVFAEDMKGKIYIYTDSLIAFTKLLELWHENQARIHKLDSINNSLWELIGAGVKFTNNIPGYYKTLEGNCRWPAYKKQLIKNGYRVYDSKKKFEPCK